MSSFKPECRKFQPNIFNKSKCTSCFRQREEHSAEALDLNRACRKVSKCGYLFVAPDWDFSNPLNRTKRWQRRWFVLFDDGELTYSVDDLPATIPQGVIDMNRVLEVSEAEDVTGNQFALAITSPDRATFVKGTSREESRWWRDVLSVFPRAHKQSGRYKRNATFPGIKASSSVLQQSRAALGRTSSPSLGQSFDNRSPAQRICFHSSVSESFSVGRPSSAPTLGGDDDAFSTKESTPPTREKKPSPPPSPLYHSTPLSSLPPSTRLLSDEHKENTPPYMDTTSSYIEDYEDNPPTSESPPTQDKVMLGLQRPRTRRTAKREARGLGHPRSKSEVSIRPSYSSSTNMVSTTEGVTNTTVTTPAPTIEPSSSFINNRISNSASPLDIYTNWKSKRPLRRYTLTHTTVPTSTSNQSAYVSPFISRSHLRLNGETGVHAWRGEEIAGVEAGTRVSRIAYSDFPSVKRFLTSNIAGSSGEVSQQQQQQMYITDLEESKREEKLKDIADSLTRPRLNTSTLSYLNKENGVKPTRDSDTSLDQQEDQQQDVPHLRNHSRHITFDDVTDASLKGQVRGDPDGGCGLDGDSSRFQLNVDTQRVELPAEDILHIKKGFLLKLSPTQDWNRHWFVLEGSGLKFFRDQNGEENGILDGIVDMSLVKNVQEKEVGRNYGFVVTTWDDKTYTFSAVTSNIRSSWVQAMRNSANLKVGDSKESLLSLGEKLEREIKNSKDKVTSSSFVSLETEPGVSTTPPTMSSSLTTLGRSFMSSEDEFKTASDSSFLKDLSRDNITSHDRLSSRSTSRGTPSSHNRSKSSPPTSRRGTRDDYPQLNSLSSASSRLQQLNNSSSSRLSEGLSVQSIQDLESRFTPEKDSNGTLNSTTGEGMLVELLETQVESLKAKLEQTQITELKNQIAKQEEEIKEKNKTISKIESIRKQFQEERREWEEKVSSEEKKVKDLKTSESKHGEIVRRLTRTLQESEAKVSSLTQELNRVKCLNRSSEMNSTTRAENAELKRQVSELTTEIARLKEALKSEKSEAYKWKDLVKELRSLLDGRNVDMEMKREEVASLREKLKETQSELDATADRLHRGIEENESLCGRLRELERQSRSQAAAAAAAAIKVRRGSSSLSLSNSKKNLPRLDSLSDLTNLDLNFDPDDMERESLVEEFKDLRIRFEKAVGEILALKKEIRNTESLQDDIELTNQRLRNELKARERDFEAQNQLMGTRVQDLTNKLSNSEKQVRTLKQKLNRSESKERRRTLSLKGKESFSLSKDLESKLTYLESMVNTFLNETEADSESQKSLLSLPETRRSKSFEESNRRAASAKLRRKSLDGQTTTDTIKTVIRVNELEEKVLSLSKRDPRTVSSNTSLSSCGTSQSTADASTNSLTLTGSSKLKSSPVMSPLRSPATPRRSSISRTSTKSPSERTSSSRVTRSDSESKNLKEKVKCLEKVLTTVEAKLSECLTCAKTIHCSCTCGEDSMSRLQELISVTARLSQCRTSVQSDQNAVRRVRPLILRINDLLKEKSINLVQRRHQLRTIGKWTKEAQFKSLAERLAFETTLLAQLAQALQSTRNPKSFEASFRLQELIEAHRKVTFLEKKLSNSEFDMEPSTPLEFYSSLLAEKLVVEGDLLGAMSPPVNQKSRASAVITETCKDLTQKVLERERSLEELVTRYKEEKLSEIAVVMARETVTGTQPRYDDSVLLEEFRLREAWAMAQDILTQEISNLEASQSVLRLANLLGPSKDADFCFAARLSASNLDRLQAGAEESLRQEMEESVFTLSAKYEEVLAAYRSGDTGVISAVAADINTVLGEFAAVIAQKALVDGQLAAAAGTDDEMTESLSIVEEKTDPMEAAGDIVESESHLLMFLGGANDPVTEGLVTSALSQAEFSFIYNKVAASSAAEGTNIANSFARDQTELLNPTTERQFDTETDRSSISMSTSGSRLPRSPKPKKRIESSSSSSSKSRRVSDVTGMINSCRQCEELRQELSRLKKSVEGKKIKKLEAECSKCLDYLKTLKHLEENHREEMEALQKQHQDEIDRLRNQVKYDPPTRDSDDELTELKRRLCLLEEGYEAQIAALKKQYQEALGSQSDVCEENIRQRYQIEIEHLRELCEKGLTAMETSHRRLVAEMEAKHHREMEQLQAEKEEALAEETQATLAALDAMRKAHEAEVQKEVAKFKEEFLRRAENGLEGEATHSRLHEEQLAEVRREILALSEKYSSKCLEMAAKEQKAESLLRQLTELKAQAKSLEERNRFLKQKLNAHLNQIQAKPGKTPEDLQRQFECEIALKDEEIAWLNQMLQRSKTHETDLGTLCGRLGHFLKTDNCFGSDYVSAVRDRFQRQMYTTLRGLEGSRPSRPNISTQNGKHVGKTSREVTRSPSCPGLSSSRFSPSLREGSRTGGLMGSTLFSPLMGVVAQRKKVFESPPTGKTEC
ncbi:UNVERIFIED_CONTAM: hypothetical protein RMT77_014550 [Armadillidium vulgare]